MTQNIQDWADARCAEYEEEIDARHCLGSANDARSQGWVDCTPEENAYYNELEMKIEADAEAWEAQCEGTW
ncbi:MAG: hypothetical protein JRG69_01845 [Deltaproteobacteria bacterium]|nr:hypothetical protein [Deltaproteobacteria bacterium]